MVLVIPRQESERDDQSHYDRQSDQDCTSPLFRTLDNMSKNAYSVLIFANKPSILLPSFRTPRQQSRGIEDKCQLGGHVNKGGQERIEKAEGGHSHSHAVHDQRAHKVLHDDPAAASSKP